MEVPIAAVADFASVTADGKLNILGIFGMINPPTIPFQLPAMYLVIVFEASPAETNQNKSVSATLLSGDGKELLRLDQQVIVPPPLVPGARVQFNAIYGIMGVTFESAGLYSFSIQVGGEEKRSVPLQVFAPKPGEV